MKEYKKVHFRKYSFTLSNSASHSFPSSVSPSFCLQSQYSFRFDIPCGKAVKSFLLPPPSTVCYSSGLLSLWLLFHFSSPKTELQKTGSLVSVGKAAAIWKSESCSYMGLDGNVKFLRQVFKDLYLQNNIISEDGIFSISNHI